MHFAHFEEKHTWKLETLCKTMQTYMQFLLSKSNVFINRLVHQLATV